MHTGPRQSVYDDALSGRGSVYGDAAYGDDIYGDDPDDGRQGGSRARGPAEGGARRRLVVVLGSVFLVLVLAGVLVGLWAQGQINPGGSQEPVTVELESGQSTAQIAQVLNDNDVIGDARVFTIYARVRSQGDIQAGTYELETNMSMSEVLSVLAEGPVLGESAATVREGLTVDQTVSYLSDPDEGPGFDEAALREALESGSVRSRHFEDGKTLEGMLYPNTYNAGDMTEAEFLQTMVDEFDQVYEDLEVEARADDVGLQSGYDVLKVASLIEKEALVEEDRAKIARVIYNRLGEDAPLAIDATNCYVKGKQPCELTAADLESDSPYNSRKHTGLPPTPIASVGRASMEAALNPADGSWFYYILNVAAGDGSHLFTDDRDEFNAAKERCEQAGKCG